MELNKEVLDCMKELRRRLRDEQAIDIRLSQPDAITLMLDGSLRSSDEQTRHLGQRLAQFSDLPQRSAPKPPAASERSADTPAGSVRIYRGQRVYA
ncbi:conserved hypothetical protein [Pseudomonas sp. 8Z]|uniref:hypothetical protein n=1 Tax=Pseudomonas sp. 8Z TaxID=2653166 RepID=UPI0012EF4285|nr:hypothetical protein [Pseudomonas sp. 8Z]VXC50040.1 conserved hypothetical protein [Pseudomonas sp. 8Z]